MTLEQFEAQAFQILPGATVVHRDTYDLAKQRLLQCIREGAPQLPQVDRWSLACEAAALSRLHCRQPYRDWAIQLIETDLAQMLALFREKGVDPGEATPDPMRWVNRVPVSQELKLLRLRQMNEDQPTEEVA